MWRWVRKLRVSEAVTTGGVEGQAETSGSGSGKTVSNRSSSSSSNIDAEDHPSGGATRSASTHWHNPHRHDPRKSVLCGRSLRHDQSNTELTALVDSTDSANDPTGVNSKPTRQKSRPWFVITMGDNKVKLPNLKLDKDLKDSKDAKDHKDHKDSKDPKDSKDDKDHKALDSNKTLPAASASDVTVGQVCRIEDSPFRIMKVAASGNLKEFKRLYAVDHSRLFLRDSKGWTVTHHAAMKGRINVLQCIMDHRGDLDGKDKKGNTPLHLAVQKGKPGAINLLLENGARPAIFNSQDMAPIHLAVEAGDVSALQALLSSEKVDVNLAGEGGQTPLHFAASADRVECAETLLEHEAKFSQRCDMGLSPIHVAAKQASVKVLELLLKHSVEHGLGNEALQSTDKDDNSLLHAAVNSGSLETVRIGLKYSASISAQQSDKSTPLHLACAQGNLEMVKAMLESQPDQLEVVLFAKDAMDMTPLHTATLYDHTDIVAYLVDQGADLDGRDKEDRTPLLIAASGQGKGTVKVLLDKGADVHTKDKRNRTFLHLAIISGAKMQEFGPEVFKKAEPLLNEIDDFGCTPLHYASKQGHLPAIERLIMMGAFLNVKNKDKQSPLHFAACYGRLNTCRRLLESPQGSTIINEIGGEGLTALHQASANGHIKVVQYLMQKGALLHRDNRGNTPLHLAADNGYTQTIKLLLGVHAHVLDAQNNDGDSALHLAASAGHSSAVTLLMSTNAEFTQNKGQYYFIDQAIQNRHKEVALAVVTHERWREALELHSLHGSPMIQLIKHLPEVCLAVLDRCQTASGHDVKSRDFHHHYDFRYLQCPTQLKGEPERRSEEYVPMAPLNIMVKFNRVECLSHPVCVTFLKMKWRAYGFWFHLINIGVYVVFLGFLTTYIVTYDPALHTNQRLLLNTTTGSSFQTTSPETTHEQAKVQPYSRLCMIAISAFCLFNVLKEMLQMLQQKTKYFRDPTNLLEWVLYVTCGVFVVPSLFGYFTHKQWQTGAIAVFLAWFNFLLYLQRFDFFGIYVVMFLEILKTLLQVIVVFSILIVAFGLSFYILLGTEDNPAHRTPVLSLVRSFIMMLGEIDYIPTFAERLYDSDGQETMHYGPLTLIFLIVFILFMPILLMNLLIGLAVGDIEAVQRNARLKRLAMQVELHTDLERKLPRRLIRHVDKIEYKVYMSSNRNAITRLIARMCHDNDDDADVTSTGSSPGTSHVANGRTSGESPRTAGSLYLELHNQQRRKLKELSNSMEKQHELLRLIVQKMEIRTEADDKDTAFGEPETPLAGLADSFHWSSQTQNVARSASIVSFWAKKHATKQHSK